MKKILQVVGQLSIGGQEMMVKNFYKYIDREKFLFDYVVYGEKIGEYEEELEKLGANIYHISYPSIKNINKFKIELNKIMKKNMYCAVHSHTYTNNGIVLQLAKKNNIPIRISHCHTTSSGKGENLFYKLYKNHMIKLVLNNSTHQIACGKEAGINFYGKTFLENGIVIKNGIDLDKFNFHIEIREKLRNKYNFSENYVLGHVGRFSDVKNHKFLIDILEQLICRDDKYRLVLVGDGKLLQYMKEYSKNKKVDDKILFLGARNNIDELLQMMDVFLLPSKYEGLPVSLIEAQATGLKCIASSNISKESNITDTVIFLDIKDENVKDWSLEIDRIILNDRLNENNSIIHEQGYDIRESCVLLEKIYLGGNMK